MCIVYTTLYYIHMHNVHARLFNSWAFVVVAEHKLSMVKKIASDGHATDQLACANKQSKQKQKQNGEKSKERNVKSERMKHD